MIFGTWKQQTWPLPWENHWYQQHLANVVVHLLADKQMEHMALMNDPELQPLWKRGFSNEAGRPFQGIRGIPGTKKCFFVDLTKIPKDRNIIYGKIVCDYKPHKKEKKCQTHGGRQQTGLLRRCGNLHRCHHNIQNLNQQHYIQKRCGHDDDGYQKLLFAHSVTSL
jgi:hypothetical protein